jgi:hypothetical protein
VDNIDRQYGGLLDQLASRSMPWPAPPVPDSSLALGTLEQMMRYDEMLMLGWIGGTPTHEGNRLADIRDLHITPLGQTELQRLRRESARPDGNGTMPESLQEKRAMRAAFMRLLYDETNGSTIADANDKELGARLGWDVGTTDLVAEYLLGEGLLEFTGFGGVVSITHAGVVEVEQGMQAPTAPTQHFPPFNQIIIGTATHVGIQQGTTNSTQHMTTITHDQHNQLLILLGEVSSVIDAWPQGDPVRLDAEERLAAARLELESTEDRARVKAAFATVAGAITKGATLCSSGEVVISLVGKLLHAL